MEKCQLIGDFAMTYQGHFQNGVIVLDDAAILPDGVKVRVEILPSDVARIEPPSKPRTHYEHYQSIIGIFDDLPTDFAAQHDHYIHGTPKK
jgi:hypothetical protein